MTEKDINKLLPTWRRYCLLIHQKMNSAIMTIMKPILSLYDKLNRTEKFEIAERQYNLNAFKTSLIQNGSRGIK